MMARVQSIHHTRNGDFVLSNQTKNIKVEFWGIDVVAIKQSIHHLL